MEFALKYCVPVDVITADKSLKLRKYELDEEDWAIIKEFVSILKVCHITVPFLICSDNRLSYIRTLHSISLRNRRVWLLSYLPWTSSQAALI